nr:class I SAM-dependent methyltransferase [uncultured Undibacterium sp.]
MSEFAFNEVSYLKLHDDVRLAIEQGYVASAWEHYEKWGRAEGRRASRLDHEYHSIVDYSKLVRRLIAEHPDNLDLAMAKAIGALTLDIYRESGDKQYHVLRKLGLRDGDAIYDLACGSGRTAAALRRNGWHGLYRGADIIEDLINYAGEKNPPFEFFVHPDFSIHAADASQDIIYSWSLFTHLQLEETFLYAKDCYRALKPDGIFVFSFLTLQNKQHRELFLSRVNALENGIANVHLDMFLDQETITIMMVDILGYQLLGFTAADDESATPSGSFGQALAIFKK